MNPTPEREAELRLLLPGMVIALRDALALLDAERAEAASQYRRGRSDALDEHGAATRALLAALPHCNGHLDLEAGGWVSCPRPATVGFYVPRDAAPLDVNCDDCAKKSHRLGDRAMSEGRFADLPAGAEIRALVAMYGAGGP